LGGISVLFFALSATELGVCGFSQVTSVFTPSFSISFQILAAFTLEGANTINRRVVVTIIMSLDCSRDLLISFRPYTFVTFSSGSFLLC
jgi:hypothetical protein